jgi:asparagine synthase (glutamine-hydrolysing)
MCGIVGKFYFGHRRTKGSDLDKMMADIYHRGPDSSGKYEDERISIGFQRLSIIDTISGHQPLYNETKNIVLLANGEIYNYKDLTRELEPKGHSFRTKSDCEVIIHLYEEYGPAFIERLNGMFAFCLYDKERRHMLIARDRVGIKPMYFYHDQSVMVFGSEIKGILAANEVKKAEEADILGEYLCFRYLANGRTFFSGIKALAPGSCIELSPEGVRFISFYKRTDSCERYSEPDFLDRLDRALCESVERQMMTDVPLGTQLSGGVDSSLVSALAGKLDPGLKTFTVGFHEKKYDETPFAKLLADKAGLDYHEVRIDNRQFSDVLPKAIWFHDEPLCHANSVQMYLLCKYAREHVKVMLTGEGADELFAGYPRYMIAKLGELTNYLSKPFAKVIKNLLYIIPSRKVNKLAYNLGFGSRDLVLWNSCFAGKEKVSWLMDTDNFGLSFRKDLLEESWNDNLNLFDNLLLYERKSYLQPILMRQDKMSMAASIESRVPVLDNQMLGIADSMPYQYKIRHYTPKYIFKKVAARHIPREIVYKKKVGFGVPVDEWLRDKTCLGRYLDMLLDSAGEIKELNQNKLNQMVEEHRRSESNHGDLLWPLINYIIWKDKFFNNGKT